MVASQSVIAQNGNTNVTEMSAGMEAHAAQGDWEQVEQIAAKLKVAVMQVPEHERRDTLLAVCSSMEKVQTLAQDARNEVTGKLSAIRRGKDATAAYTHID